MDALEATERGRRSESIWSNAGERPLDLRLAELADLYWDASESQRRRIREAVDPRRSWDLLVSIRRVALLIEGPRDVQWLRRGLAIAAIENDRSDYRDLIVSLVLLRHGAERAGIRTRKHFNDAIRIADRRIHDYLKNARDHRASDVRLTVREFGPPQWRRQRLGGAP